MLSGRSVAGQVFVLQVVVVLVLVAAAVVALVLQARYDSTQEARNRSLAVAETFAAAPGTLEALSAPDPTAVLQPRAEAAREATGVDFIVVMNPDGIRYTHPLPDRIGKKFVGNIEPALAGEPVTEEIDGTIGRLVQAVVPVQEPDGTVVGLVSAGVTTEHVGGAADRQLPLVLVAAAVGLAVATAGTALVSRRLLRQTHGLGPREMTRMYEHHDAVLHAVREGVLIIDGEGALLLANDEARRLLDLPEDAEGRDVRELGLDPATAELLASRRVATDEVRLVKDRLLAINQRPTDVAGGPAGSVATLRDSTELRALSGRAEVARERLDMLYAAGVGIGTSLDVTRTAEELTELAVARFADFVTVDLFDAVLAGEQPEAGLELRRTAFGGIRQDPPLYPVGRRIRFVGSSPQARSLRTGQAILEPRADAAPGWQAQDLESHRAGAGVRHPLADHRTAAGRIAGPGAGQLLAFPQARAVRRGGPGARRGTGGAGRRLHRQRPPLHPRAHHGGHPPGAVCCRAACPSRTRWTSPTGLSPGAGRGGRGLVRRTAAVRGPGRPGGRRRRRARAARGGHHGPAADGRAQLLGAGPGARRAADAARRDGGPDRPAQEAEEDGSAPVTGATCLYAIYDPVSRHCAIARAGHPPPALVRQDGVVEFPEVPAGPPLGLGGLPFETADLELAEGSRLVLYTDGLVEDRVRDIDVGLDLLREALEHAGPSPEDTCRAVVDARLSARPSDDIALLVARCRALGPDRVAAWDVPPDPAAVAEVRSSVTRRLADWGLEDLAFTTELILSELVTNAIRYGGTPIRVRVLRDRTLICEVFDSSSTAPHLRYAAMTDEGGRGLFLVAQLAERWGTRYLPSGKVIWAEQPLP
ncbi:hypothetical protein SGLAM104S_05864 [Streptomyces glaucescens]